MFADAFLDILLPNRCTRCNFIIGAEEVICEACFDKINFTHWSWTVENELSERCRLLFPVKNAWGLMVFEEKGLSREIIHDLKYRQREKVGKFLAECCAERLSFDKDKPHMIVPVPLHPRKLRERGYNQLDIFSKTLSARFKIPYEPRMLKRNFYKSAQALKDKEHRASTSGLFSLTKPITDAHVLIVDDVFTTGNTMAAAAWEFLQKGNNSVSVVVMAVD